MIIFKLISNTEFDDSVDQLQEESLLQSFIDFVIPLPFPSLTCNATPQKKTQKTQQKNL